MDTETDYLRTIAAEIAARPEVGKADPHLVMEAKRLEKAVIHCLNSIENFTQRDTYHFNTLSKLVNICDALFGSTGTVNPNAMVLLELMAAIKGVIPAEIRPNLKLPKAFVMMQGEFFAERWSHQSRIMTEQQISKKLVDIAGIPFVRFIEGKQNLNWGDFTWLKGYLAKLEIVDWENADCKSPAEALLSLLIGRDFNDDRFYIYCKKYIEVRVNKVSGKRNRLLEFAQCEKLVLQDTQADTASFDQRANTVSTRLLKWIKEEIDFVETHEREHPVTRFEFKWNVETIAFFFKLLWDHKVFGKVFLEQLSEQIASNCSSIGKEEFQASTIYSRFYVKDLEVVKAMEELLAGMLADVRKYLQ
jgi:hypothetical protein